MKMMAAEEPCLAALEEPVVTPEKAIIKENYGNSKSEKRLVLE